MTARLHKEATQKAPIQQNVHFSGMQLYSLVLCNSQLQSGSSTLCRELHIFRNSCKRKVTIRVSICTIFLMLGNDPATICMCFHMDQEKHNLNSNVYAMRNGSTLYVVQFHFAQFGKPPTCFCVKPLCECFCIFVSVFYGMLPGREPSCRESGHASMRVVHTHSPYGVRRGFQGRASPCLWTIQHTLHFASWLCSTPHTPALENFTVNHRKAPRGT